MNDRWILFPLAVFMLLYGFLAVTNVSIEFAKPLMGFAALFLGIVCIVKAVK